MWGLPSEGVELDEIVDWVRKESAGTKLADRGQTSTRPWVAIAELLGVDSGYPTCRELMESIEDDLVLMIAEAVGINAESGVVVFGTQGVAETAIAASLEYNRVERGRCSLIAADTAPGSFAAASARLGMTHVTVPTESNNVASAETLLSVADEHTSLVVCCAPCSPYGRFDRLEEIATEADAEGICLHTDVSWQGAFWPSLLMDESDAGYPLPPPNRAGRSFAVNLGGAGLGPLGTWVLLFENYSGERGQTFVHATDSDSLVEYPGQAWRYNPLGVCAAWTSLKMTGGEGLWRMARSIETATGAICDHIESIDGHSAHAEIGSATIRATRLHGSLAEPAKVLSESDWNVNYRDGAMYIELAADQLDGGPLRQLRSCLDHALTLRGDRDWPTEVDLRR